MSQSPKKKTSPAVIIFMVVFFLLSFSAIVGLYGEHMLGLIEDTNYEALIDHNPNHPEANGFFDMGIFDHGRWSSRGTAHQVMFWAFWTPIIIVGGIFFAIFFTKGVPAIQRRRAQRDPYNFQDEDYKVFGQKKCPRGQFAVGNQCR